MKVVIASQNQHKIQEINASLLKYGLHVVSMKDEGFDDDIPETGQTLDANAEIKAKYLAERLSSFVLADDSGLEVDILNGAPGVYSARYAGPQRSDEDNMVKLLSTLEEEQDRSAQFRTVLHYIQGDIVRTFEGIVRGQIAKSPKGSNGFGYDPIFIPEGYSRTFAEMSAEEKNSISHRARAVEKFTKWLDQQS